MTPTSDTILDADRPIIDPHHHLWDWPKEMLEALPFPEHGFMDMLWHKQRYLLDEFLADVRSGHNIRATVFIETTAMYRADAPQAWQSLGETEFANGVAAMSASGFYGETRVCAGIVGHVDLRLGDQVGELLQAHIGAAGGRLRGIRHSASWDADPNVMGPASADTEGLYLDPEFRKGFARLQPLGLTFDAWLAEPQLPELLDLARAFPDTTIVLNHLGTPLGIGPYRGKRDERFAGWQANVRALAECDNVVVKLGGLAMPYLGTEWSCQHRPNSYQELATAWAPYIETGIEAFGADRCMFESNFPVDWFSCSYDQVWNTFKHLTRGCSEAEKTALFSGTAARIYQLAID